MLQREQINIDIKANKQETQLWQNLDIFQHFYTRPSWKKQ